MNAIVLVDANWGIAKDGKQIIYIPEDLRHFKLLTMGNTILYGRKTLEAFPDQKPLSMRDNICLSTTLSIDYAEELEIIRDVDDIPLYILLSNNTFCVGGASLYRQLFRTFQTVYVTRVWKHFDADQFFPNLDAHDLLFKRTYESKRYATKDGIDFQYMAYERKLPICLRDLRTVLQQSQGTL